MTALLAITRLAPSRRIRITHPMTRVEPFREGLRVGERVRAWKLEFGLMLFSGNDDAVALATAVSGSSRRFVALMNATARQLALRDTRYASPSGLADAGRSSAHDLAALTRFALRDPRFARLVRTRIKRVEWSPPTFSKIYVNKNRLLTTYPGADGVKTGWTTKARHCLVASAHRGGMHLIAVVLDSSDAYVDARRLLNFGFRLEGA
jgi:D-alanyl-D-alanine carboxypeptidase (penicillin-binding protein 5/6)